MLKNYILLFVSTLLLCIPISSCGSTGTETSNTNDTAKVETTTKETETTTTTTTTTKATTTSVTTTTIATTTTATKVLVENLSEARVQYNKEENCYELMFALSDSEKNFVDASGTAKIQVKDKLGNVIFDKEKEFDKSNFLRWTNWARDDYTYGCWLLIPYNEVKGAASRDGTLTLKVSGKDFRFEEIKMSILDLPTKEADIKLPEMPISVSDTRYSRISYVTISDLTCETEYDYGYSDEMTLELNMVVTLDNKVGNQDKADIVVIGYKLIDDEGFIVEQGETYTEALKVGEKTRKKTYIYNLDPSKSYTLTFEDVSV